MSKKQKKYRQYRSNQGRSPQDMESKYQGCIWTAGFGFVLILGTVTLTCYAIYHLINI